MRRGGVMYVRSVVRGAWGCDVRGGDVMWGVHVHNVGMM